MNNKTNYTQVVILTITIFGLLMLGFFFYQRNQKAFSFKIPIGEKENELSFSQNQYEKFYFTKNEEEVFVYNPKSKAINRYKITGSYQGNVKLNLENNQLVSGIGIVNNELLVNTVSLSEGVDESISAEWFIEKNGKFIKVNSELNYFSPWFFNSINVNRNRLILKDQQGFFGAEVVNNEIERKDHLDSLNEFNLNISKKEIQNSGNNYNFNITVGKINFNHKENFEKMLSCDDLIYLDKNKIVCTFSKDNLLKDIDFNEITIFSIDKTNGFKEIESNVLDVKIQDNYVLTMSLKDDHLLIKNTKV